MGIITPDNVRGLPSQRPSPGFVVRDEQGNEVVYPVVMVHIFSDAALQTMVQAVTRTVLDALEVRGVIPQAVEGEASVA